MTTSLWDPASEGLLKRRAEQLARQAQSADARADVEVLMCRLGAERYAIETRSLRAVQWASGIIPVPCTPDYVRGIVSVRGEIVTMLDLASMIGLSLARGDSETHAMLLLGIPGLRAGPVVDEVMGVERLPLDSLQSSLSGREYVRGVAPDLTMLLDLEQLFASGRFNVLDEVV